MKYIYNPNVISKCNSTFYDLDENSWIEVIPTAGEKLVVLFVKNGETEKAEIWDSENIKLKEDIII